MASFRLGSARAVKPPATSAAAEAKHGREDARSLVNRLVAEMNAAWRNGTRVRVEEYLGRYPTLADHPGDLVWLIHEEISLRREAGEQVVPDAILRRFPGCRAELSGLFEGPSTEWPAATAPAYPEVGERLGEFTLQAELGRGQTGRVFLAAQGSLGDRPVVLKATPRDGREHVTLARFAHPAVVPVLSALDLPERGLLVFCMPWLGGATLDVVLDGLRAVPPGRWSGREILRQLDRAGGIDRPADSPARRFLEGASHARAVAWIGATLADALSEAHARGLIHLDVKPSNVLVTADGWPMLLDFHLARAPVAAGARAEEGVGGTPGFMSLEQSLLLAAWRQGRPAPLALDGRSDLYSLGVLLDHALQGAPADGRAPLPQPPVARGVPVPRWLNDVVARCVADHPDDRYPNAALVVAELRGHLRRMRPEGDVRPDFDENRPGRLRSTARIALRAAVVAAVVAAGFGGWTQARRLDRQAREALARGRSLILEADVGAAETTLRRGLAAVRYLPFGVEGLRRDLDDQLRRAARVKAARNLHGLAEQVRFLDFTASLPPDLARSLDRDCRTVWNARDRLTRPVGGPLAAETEREIVADLFDLAVFRAELRARLGPGADDQESAAAAALEILADAETTLGPSPVLDWERWELTRMVGGSETSRHTVFRPPAIEPRTAWEHTARGRSLLRSGDFEAAIAAFDQALELQPQAFWPYFDRGVCCYRLGRYDEAVAAFSAGVALAPSSPECRYNRGLAHAALGDDVRALRDYDRALRINPGLGPAALNRGLLRYRLGLHADAESDLRLALARGEDPATVHYHLALVRRALGDRSSALTSLQFTRQRHPASRLARDLQDRIRNER